MEKSWKYIVGAVVLVFVLYGAFVFGLSHHNVAVIDLDKAAAFGDSFGVMTSIFSGLAFVGLIITILMQQKQLQLQSTELGLQRTELALTREELAKSATSQADQTKEMKLSAELNAVSTLAQIYDERSLGGKRGGTYEAEAASKYIKRLEDLVRVNERERDIETLLDKMSENIISDEDAEKIVHDIIFNKKK